MSWQVLVASSVFFAIIRDSLTKQITRHLQPLVSMVVFYIGSIIGATLLSFFIFKQNPFWGGHELWLIRLFGIFFGVGVYAMFEAIKINFTKFQIFGSYRNLISIILSFIFLGEMSLFSIQNWHGFKNILGLTCFVLALIVGQGQYSNKEFEKAKENKQFLLWLFLSIFLIGGGLFFVKVFVRNIAPITILVNQYIGSLFIILIFVFLKKMPLFVKSVYSALAFLNGFITAAALALLYMALKFGPVSLVTPVENLMRTALVIPIGLLFFKESKLFNKKDIIGLLIALVGTALLAIP